MKHVSVSEIQQHPIESFSGDEAIAIEHEGEILGYFHPKKRIKQEKRTNQEEIDRTVQELDAVIQRILDQTGMTEDEFADLFDLNKPFPYDADH